MNIYQSIIIGICIIRLFVSAARDGKTEERTESFPVTFMTTLAWAWLLYEAGAFNIQTP